MLLIYLSRMFISMLIGLLIGSDREHYNKPCGLRTVTFIILGATLVTLMTLRLDSITINNSFDAIRAIAYYLVAIGFVGGGIITQNKGKVEGITTAALLLPMAVIGVLIGLGEYPLGLVATLVIYLVLKLKYIKLELQTFRKKKEKNKILKRPVKRQRKYITARG